MAFKDAFSEKEVPLPEYAKGYAQDVRTVLGEAFKTLSSQGYDVNKQAMIAIADQVAKKALDKFGTIDDMRAALKEIYHPPLKAVPVKTEKTGGRKFEGEFDRPEQLRDAPAKAPKAAAPKPIEDQVKDEIEKLARKLERQTPEWKASYTQRFNEGNVASEATKLADKDIPVSQAARSTAVNWARDKFIEVGGDSQALLKAIQKINR